MSDDIAAIARRRIDELQHDNTISDVDKLVAWYAFYARPQALAHVEVYGPDHPSMVNAQPELTLEALARVLRVDRAQRLDSPLLILHKRDDQPWQVLTPTSPQEALQLYDTLAMNWTETYLVSVVRGPRDTIERLQREQHLP